MKQLLILSKKLSEWHVKNLNNFIFIAFDNVASVEIDYDVSQGPGSYVIFNVKKKDSRKKIAEKSQIARRCQDVEHWVRSIIWEEVRVEIKVNNKNIFVSKQNLDVQEKN